MVDHILIEVTPDNVNTESLFCIKDISSPGFSAKKEWFLNRYAEGLRLKILKNQLGKPLAFIEYIPSEFAWRPVQAQNYYFIHCMFVYAIKDKNRGIGSWLLSQCLDDAARHRKDGICVMTSDGTWISNKQLFLKNGYQQVANRDRFELLALKINPSAEDPGLVDWNSNQEQYLGWNLVYSDQCPWNEKSAAALKKTADEYGIELKLTHIRSAQEAQQAPSGFAVFSLLRDGRLIEDHYISETRFKNILTKELKMK
ncbi:MAG: YoaP domain-containing protein [Bacteroidales bacterium]|nr:YoaP domain-containing protein [Bacteroidales bacterium]